MGIINFITGVFLIGVPALVLAETLETAQRDSNK
jgi:hypothetical protein